MSFGTFFFFASSIENQFPISLRGRCKAGAPSSPKESTFHPRNSRARTAPNTFLQSRDGLCSSSASGSPVTAGSLGAQVQRLSAVLWGSYHTDHVSRCTQSLVFSKDKNQVRSYKLKISTKII